MSRAPARPRCRLALAVLACTLAWGVASAAPAVAPGTGSSNPSWEQLTPAQQRFLKRKPASWNALPAARKQALLKMAEHWQHMTPAQRKQAEARRRHWESLSPQEKAEIRQHRAQFQRLTPAQQASIRARERQFHALPPAQQQAIRDCRKQQKAGKSVDCRALLKNALAAHAASAPSVSGATSAATGGKD